jgi:hypothetical protein
MGINPLTATVGTNIPISYRGVSVRGVSFTRGISVLGLSCGVEASTYDSWMPTKFGGWRCPPRVSRSSPEAPPRFSLLRQTFSRLSHGDPANLNPAGWFLDFSTVDSLAQFLPMSFYPPGKGPRKGISPFPDVYPDPGCLMENKVWPAKGVSTKRIVSFHGAPPKSCQNFTYSYAECLRRYLRPMDGENL